MLVYQSLSGHALGYLVDDCQLVTDASVRQMRSADARTLAVNRTSSSFGDMTFAAAGTRVWNSLPPDLRQSGLSYGHTVIRSGGHWTHFYLDSETTAQCELFERRRLEIFLLTYLHMRDWLSWIRTDSYHAAVCQTFQRVSFQFADIASL